MLSRHFQRVHPLHRPCFPRVCAPDRGVVQVTNLDGRQFPALKTPQGRKRKFQRLRPENDFTWSWKVLVDAPCSGDGTLRKSCGGWATWRAAEGNSLHPLQRGLLRRGFELLEPGGRLVYSTCSLNPIENEAVVAAFLSETSNAELLSWDPLKVESFQEGVTEWMVPESDFETSRLMHKSYDAPQLPKSQAALFPPKNELLQASLRRCRRLVPLSPEAHHGGFFVAVVTKSKGPKSPNPSAAQEWEPVEVEADLEQKVKKHPMRRLFQPVPVERWAALQAYWSLDLPVERLSANRLGQLVLATRTLAACCVSRKVDLPIVEGGLALFPAEGLKPFDEAVSFLSGYTPRKKQLTLMEFLEMVKAEQKEEEEEEEDLHIFTLEAVTEPCKRVFAVLGATQNGRAWCVASPRYRQVLLEVLREIVKTRDVQQSKEDAALSC
ncbi:unnamed protein product [Durusdinium trenchii]|uniref:SAM-dependent MTase RsmB/NOP-type domain-containing protein n=1 Tax=Durusdinium trenchii TaxID=1381693 RepID=A0ABP0STY6_9DINO